MRPINLSPRLRVAVALLPATLFVLMSGCAQMPTHGQGAMSRLEQASCNPAVTGAIGAVAGALLGGSHHRAVGAAIGAGVGALACVAYNYHVKKVASAQTVERAYQRHNGRLPVQPTVAAYRSRLVPSSDVVAGGSTQLQSQITVLNGQHSTPPQITEQLALYAPDGKKLSTVSKPASDIDGSGEYQTTFTFNLPKGIAQGRYLVKSTVFLDGKPVRSNQVPMVVVG